MRIPCLGPVRKSEWLSAADLIQAAFGRTALALNRITAVIGVAPTSLEPIFSSCPWPGLNALVLLVHLASQLSREGSWKTAVPWVERKQVRRTQVPVRSVHMYLQNKDLESSVWTVMPLRIFTEPLLPNYEPLRLEAL